MRENISNTGNTIVVEFLKNSQEWRVKGEPVTYMYNFFDYGDSVVNTFQNA